MSDKVVNEITTACLGDVSGEDLPEIKASPENIPPEAPVAQTPTETPPAAPEASPEQAPIAKTSKPVAPAKKPATPAKKPLAVEPKPTGEPKKATAPSNNPTAAYSDKEKSGLDRFSRLISTSKSNNNETPEAK